jgi:hypothetical protein
VKHIVLFFNQPAEGIVLLTSGFLLIFVIEMFNIDKTIVFVSVDNIW